MLTNLLILFCVAGAAFVAMSIPLILRKVPPGPYGLRTRATLKNADIWYPANAYAARRFLCVGLATIVAAVTAYFVPGVTVGVYSGIVLAVMAVGFAVTLVQSFGYVGRLDGESR